MIAIIHEIANNDCMSDASDTNFLRREREPYREPAIKIGSGESRRNIRCIDDIGYEKT